MKTVEVDVYVVVGLHHESRLAAEGGDPHVAHHRFVCQVSVHSSSGSAISKSKALLVGVFKVALDDVHVNCTFGFQLKYHFSQNPSHLSVIKRNAHLCLF